MKAITLALGATLLLLAAVCAPAAEAETNDLRTVVGTVRHLRIEGGFFGIVGDDGARYNPLKTLPPAYRKDGLRVRARGRLRRGAPTFQMWGVVFEIVAIEPCAAGDAPPPPSQQDAPRRSESTPPNRR